MTAQTGGSDQDLAGSVLISAADMGIRAVAPLPQRIAGALNNSEALAGVTAESMAEELATLSDATFAAAAPGLAKKPLLVLTSDDGLAPMSDALVAEVKRRGGEVTVVHAATDHG